MVQIKNSQPDSKLCDNCGRKMEYRKKWARDWENVRYCGEKCRRNRKSFDYAPAILELLRQRGPGKTICPSEVLMPNDKTDKNLMEQVRRCARRLASAGSIEITQNGRPVDPTDFRGPIRLRLVAKHGEGERSGKTKRKD